MKEHDSRLTLQETEQLCRLYMDCRLTVVEETELQYVLGKLPYSSPCIDEVRMLMGITLSAGLLKPRKKYFGFRRYRTAIRIAASFAIIFVIGISLFNNHSLNSGSSASDEDGHTYIAAYRHGERLKGSEAIAATNIAMAKADSLMKYASFTERDCMIKANDIISATIKN
ncbi:MAG: hypothetical protein K2K05_04740 [Muribaculaceae bacterium]|nr:hypothetical protein [Muribaculaceae bacterium]